MYFRSAWFPWRKTWQDCEFWSGDLQEDKNERETRENQLTIQNHQMQAQQSQAIQALLQQQAQIWAFFLQRRSLFQVNCAMSCFTNCYLIFFFCSQENSVQQDCATYFYILYIVLQKIINLRNFIEKLLQEVCNMSEVSFFWKSFFLYLLEFRLRGVGK